MNRVPFLLLTYGIRLVCSLYVFIVCHTTKICTVQIAFAFPFLYPFNSIEFNAIVLTAISNMYFVWPRAFISQLFTFD